MRLRFVLTVLLVCCTARSLLAQEVVADLAGSEPQAIFAAPDGIFVLQYPRRAVRWRGAILGEIRYELPDGYSVSEARLALNSADGTVWIALSGHKSSKDGKTRFQEVYLTACRETCERKQLFRSKTTEAREEALSLDNLVVDPTGAPWLLASYSLTTTTKDEKGNEKRQSQTEDRTYDASGAYRESVWPTGERVFFDREGRYVSVNSSATAISVVRIGKTGKRERAELSPAMYHWSVIEEAGGLRFFFHDPESKSLNTTLLDDQVFAGEAPIAELVETEEAGIENMAMALPDGWAVISYFYRNAFYKGLKVVRRTSERTDIIDLAASPERNIGWRLKGAIGSDGSVLVSYLDDVLQQRHTMRHFPDIETLLQAGQPEPTGWEHDTQSVFLLAGAGAMYARWALASDTPADLPAGGGFDVDYTLADTISTEAILEARIGSTKIGATYLHSIVSSEIESAAGKSASRAFDLVSAVVGWDQLFLYHDVQLRLEWGQMQGLMDVANRPASSREVDTERRLVEVGLLNAYRVKWGLSYVNMTLPMPAYAWAVDEGEQQFHYLAGAIRRTAFHDLALFLAYSTLDYTAKYEVNVAQLYFDLRIDLGGSYAGLANPLAVAAPYDSPDARLTWLVGGTAELGYLLQLRSYALHGLGIYARIGVRARGTYGIDGTPADLEEPATSAETRLTVDRKEGYIGPYLSFGLVY